MRKVYQNEKNSLTLPLAVLLSVGFTALLFGFIPFAHRVNRPQQTLELRTTHAVDLPPPVEEAPPPQIEEQKPPEAAPEPQLADTPQTQIPISADLDIAVGTGGALSGFGEIRALTAAQTATEDAFDVSDLEKRPEAVSRVDPVYPAELRKAGIEGRVTLVFVLSEDGRVEDPRVENSSRPEFEKPALEAIRKWRFRPGEKDGKAVRTYIKIPFKFTPRA